MKNNLKPAPKMVESLKWLRHKKTRRCGVYMLMWKRKVVYIGASGNVSARVTTHRTEGRIRFDSVRVAKVPASRLLATEKALIEKHQPRYNHSHTERAKDGKTRDTRRVVSFNLPSLTIWQLRQLSDADHRSMTQWLQLEIDRLYESWWLREQQKKDAYAPAFTKPATSPTTQPHNP